MGFGINDLIKFKIQNRYADLPDENYKPIMLQTSLMLFARSLQVISAILLIHYGYMFLARFNPNAAILYMIFVNILMLIFSLQKFGFPTGLIVMPSYYLLMVYFYVQLSF